MNSKNVSQRASQSGGLSHAAPRILFGVTGGIAAYKAVTAIRRLRQWGADVVVVPTHAALDMVGKTTWEAISGNRVHVDVSENANDVVHVNTGAQADLLVIAPATANTIAKLAHGLADNLLTASALVATCPRLIAPAMHTQMWMHPATKDNIATMRRHGWELIGPETGQLTGSDIGPGRMSEPEDIAQRAIDILTERGFGTPAQPAETGQNWVISAGGTHEAIDPVRYIANHSTGIMGVELANAARARGHHVTLVAANLSADVLARCAPDIDVIPVVSALDVHDAMLRQTPRADVVIMAAAIGDFRVDQSTTKIKRGESLTIELKANPDILHEIAINRAKQDQCVIGFAAETGDEKKTYIDYGIAKAKRKGADLLVINQVGDGIGFGNVDTNVTIVSGKGQIVANATGSKPDVAEQIIETISHYLP
ncbi:bifunctional phosphopantothenoylcysteine decarboxylase/phosphopantothenate--cysteine ligase CoaBC [Arcanobacterium buesumense]|uniref:Coenzyme A biosynthesis bifunctional protein CoaBC n=1 Tax=Arcanobacterium buesumense TaxID=2722751 RepID=A0A6H2EL81_9ACTO|nr:bifunctional phosphopantothenoylcysteine decarboxylase/phosphopantothenate--cysteine ligase CoaBC [Arcanobacterium buesumense]QJC21761.1 bifunctional phosphopantothenoylcysteine decarboxylase/phosphopantothenate--cysteine ligase CoaBC [Arcanobacterium buesumense]